MCKEKTPPNLFWVKPCPAETLLHASLCTIDFVNMVLFLNYLIKSTMNFIKKNQNFFFFFFNQLTREVVHEHLNTFKIGKTRVRMHSRRCNEIRDQMEHPGKMI